MRFDVLGRLEVFDGDGEWVAPGSPKQQVLLALLLCRPNQAISVEALIDALWGESPPKTAKTNLQVYVHRLRVIVFADPARIEYRQGGYRLVVKKGELDAERFERLAVRARRARDRGDLLGAAELFAASVRQWKGCAFAGIDRPLVRREALRLSELESTVQEERLQLELELDRHAAALPTLTRLVAENPFRERLRALLMLALYHTGHITDALACFDEGRVYLADRLGLDPGVELQRLERVIRQGDLVRCQSELALPA